MGLEDTVVEVYKQLTRRDGFDSLEQRDLRLAQAVKLVYDARQRKKVDADIEKENKNVIMEYLNLGESLDIPEIGLKVSVSPRVSVDMDEEKLTYILKELIKENPEIADVVTEETVIVTKINDSLLHRYMDEGLIDEKLILPCITEKVSSMLNVKKLKGGGE